MNDRLATASRVGTTRQVLKYPLDFNDTLTVRVDMPISAEIVHVHEQHGVPTLWVEAPTSSITAALTSTHVFHLVPTDGEVHYSWQAMYIGTVHIDWTAWHVYEGVR